MLVIVKLAKIDSYFTKNRLTKYPTMVYQTFRLK